MAVLKAGKSGQSLARAIHYAAKDSQQENRPELASGENCDDNAERAIKEMMETKIRFHKLDGRQYKNYIQSFRKGEISPEKANEIGREWARTAFGKKGFECFIGTHIHSRSGCIHNHIIVHTVNALDGRKLQVNKNDLEHFKDLSDELCRKNGLSVIDRNQQCVVKRNRQQAYENDKYSVLHTRVGKSYLQEAATALEKTLAKRPRSRETFILYMRQQGWETRFRGEKHITFSNAADPTQKVRAENLARTYSQPKFTRMAIERGFLREGRKQEADQRGQKAQRLQMQTRITRQLERLQRLQRSLRPAASLGNKLPCRKLKKAPRHCRTAQKISKKALQKNLEQTLKMLTKMLQIVVNPLNIFKNWSTVQTKWTQILDNLETSGMHNTTANEAECGQSQDDQIKNKLIRSDHGAQDRQWHDRRESLAEKLVNGKCAALWAEIRDDKDLDFSTMTELDRKLAMRDRDLKI